MGNFYDKKYIIREAEEILQECSRKNGKDKKENIKLQKDLKKLTKYAENIGLAFQIKDDILSEEGDPKITGKPVGNDKEMGKCTYVSYYGLDGAKKELDKITQEAIEQLKDYGEKAEFLSQLATYIKNRNK